MNERTFGNFVENASAKIFSFYLSDCKTGGTSSKVLVSSGCNIGWPGCILLLILPVPVNLDP